MNAICRTLTIVTVVTGGILATNLMVSHAATTANDGSCLKRRHTGVTANCSDCQTTPCSTQPCATPCDTAPCQECVRCETGNCQPCATGCCKTGCAKRKCRKCPDCNVCVLELDFGKEKKTCFKVEQKQVCVPKIRFPWQKKCPPGISRSKTVTVLKKHTYECDSCGYKWTVLEPECAPTDSAPVAEVKNEAPGQPTDATKQEAPGVEAAIEQPPFEPELPTVDPNLGSSLK